MFFIDCQEMCDVFFGERGYMFVTRFEIQKSGTSMPKPIVRQTITTGPVAHLITPQEATTKATKVYRELRATIRGGDLTPGKKLPLEWLRESYDTSMSPCREALARLVGEGYVVAEGKKGFHVRGISREDFLSIFELRNELETSALRKSINNITVDLEARLVACYYRLTRPKNTSLRDKVEFEHRETEHRAFHLELLSECYSSWLLRFYDQLARHIERYRRILVPKAISTPSFLQEVDLEHKQLMEYSIAGQVEKAVALLIGHRSRTYDQVLENI